MNSIKVIDTGIVYRNQKPHLRAIHAMHPTVSAFPDGEIVSTYDLGQGPESLDYRTELSRSRDGGKTWTDQGPLIATPPGRPSTHSIRTSLLTDGRMIGLGALMYRDDLEEGLLNRANLGYVPTDMFLVESRDRGNTGPVWGRTFDGRKNGHIHWEQGAVQLADERILSTTWDYNPKTGKNHQ